MNEQLYILWLSMFDNISNNNKLLLLDLFKSGENIFKATEKDFKNRGFFDNKIIFTILSSKNINDVLSYKSALDKLNISFVNILEKIYPYLLKKISNPPILLYYKGKLPTNDDTLISVVGTRLPSSYGENVTMDICKDLTSHGIGIVSGLAYGIDTIAHCTALENNGYTIAVLGSGLDNCYPKSNYNLMNKISENGLILSEYGLNKRVFPSNFPNRNRIIAGLSCATIVCESPVKGGALITADMAITEGRDVFTFPADIYRKKSLGNNELIKDGAIPITNIDDVFNNINFIKEDTNCKNNNLKEDKLSELNNLSDEETSLLEHFTYEGISIDMLIEKTDFTIEKIQFLLTMLEFKSIIKKLPNQKFVQK